MLLKWLITGLILYFLYKTFFSDLSLPGPKRQKKNIEHKQEQREEAEGEYIDYEEVD